MKKSLTLLLVICLMVLSGCMVSKNKYNELYKKNKELELRVSALSGVQENLKKEYAKLMEEKMVLKNDYDTAVSEKAALKAEYSKLIDEKVTVTAKFDRLNSEKTNLEKKIKELEVKLEAAQAPAPVSTAPATP